MDFQFILPLTNGDLLNSSRDTYYVKYLYSPGEIPDKLRACKQVLHQGDPFYLFDHFDTYYAVIENKNTDSVAMTNLSRSFDLLYLTVDKLGNRLAPFLAVSDTPTQQERNGFLNLTKMCLFLIVNVVRKIDANIARLQQQQQTNVQKKRGKHADTVEQYPDWEVKRGKFLVQLYNIMQFPLEKLWSPPMAEENFVNLLCDVCYRTLEILHVRADNRHIVETVFQIFGTAIKRYQHAMNFPVRILQILRTSEHAAVSIANGINVLHEEYGITSIFSVLIKEIVESLTLDSADTVISRNFSNFLMELASIAPKLMIPHLSTLCDELLNCESHVLRNCILQIMGDAIVDELTSEELSEELKEARNEFLENLLMHINDVSAHVRAKVLQIWHHMKEEQAVPLSFQLKVLGEAVERLEDKTSSVRKHAVQLIKAFLERNPYSAKLTLAELHQKHDEEVQKMEKLTELLNEERKKAEELEEQWNLVIPQILPFVEQSVREKNAPIETQENYEDLVQRIATMLLDKNYKEAVVLVRQADHVAGNSELRLSLRHEEQCAYYMALLKSYVFLANGCKDSNEELGTQIKTVQFLQDSIEFSKVVSRAMPKLQEMLLSKTNTDVYEAVDLFTTGYMFGIKGTENGMRQMLYLVWSSDKEKRDAVSDAYKKVLFATDQTGRAHALLVVQNLSSFLEDLEYGHYTAMECLIKEWVSSEDIDGLIIQPDEDLVGATAEDNIAELINHICEEVLLYGEDSLLAKIFPYIMEICKYPIKYQDPSLQQAATLALVRFMSVSSKFCETHMPFLMNILNHTKNIKIKCNIVIGLSDLTFRFPNIIEPWTGHFYSTLHEEDTELRLTAVKMLSHLILHEMIRVKGQIADLAMCIVDPHAEIKNITQQFFKEIANKSNILYNVLPDIISKLSDTSLSLEEEKYRIIMRYILGLIQKDRQVETLVEKLCLRFPVTREERQWRDIAYCLSLLSYNEKTIKKLIDNVQYFKDKVQVDEVYQSFKLIISNTSKLAKPELKTAIQELETRINECLEIREPNEEKNSNEENEKDTAPAGNNHRTKNNSKLLKVSNRTTNRRGGGRGVRRKSSSEDDSEFSPREGEAAKKPVSKSKSARGKKAVTSSESEPSSESEDDRPQPSKAIRKPASNISTVSRRAGARTSRNKVIQETGSSEEDIPQRKRVRNNK